MHFITSMGSRDSAYPCPQVFSAGTLVFLPPQKINISKFQFHPETVEVRATLRIPLKFLFIYLIYFSLNMDFKRLNKLSMPPLPFISTIFFSTLPFLPPLPPSHLMNPSTSHGYLLSEERSIREKRWHMNPCCQ